MKLVKNRRRKDKFAVFTLFWPFLLFITYLLRIHHNYDKKDPHAITNRLRVHLPIFGNKTLDVDLGEKGKICISFSPRNFWPYFWAFLDHWKWVWHRWANNANCEYKYLTNQTQQSRKQWSWQFFWALFIGFKKLKKIRFFNFRYWMCHRGKVYYISEN